MFQRLTIAAALAVCLVAAPAYASVPGPPPITEAQLMGHIEMLASDAFEGRAPGTEGERRTTSYIISELEKRGVRPAAPDGSWLQPVALVERRPLSQRAAWRANGRRIAADPAKIGLTARDERHRIADAPVVFVGHGLVDRARRIDQLAGADLRGTVALLLVEAPVEGFPAYEERARIVAAAGAAAVIGIVSDDVPFDAVLRYARAGDTRLASRSGPAIEGVMPASEAARLIALSGGSFASVLDEQPGPAFRAVPLTLRATLDARTSVRRFTSHNVVGRIAGMGNTPAAAGGVNESVLLLGHWDHLGICGNPGDADRICNGAVDNASGIATLIEVAGRLAGHLPNPRDILILATTAEEVGLLGAEHFAARPPVPLASIVAAVNFDTVAIHGAGQPVAVIGRGLAPLDAVIAATAGELRREMDTTHAADAFVQRQDGWALSRAGVPAVMVGGSFADMAALQRFLGGDYHGAGDNVRADLPLAGAAEDANFAVLLARRLADPGRYSPSRP
ncbi:MAG TPA: M28 family peptidase [Allosphingosinicella sp.]|jgi:hypothetical protein